MGDRLEERIRTILLCCPLGPGEHEDDLDIFSKRLAEIGLARNALNRPSATKMKVERYLRGLRFAARKMIGDLGQAPFEVIFAMDLDKNDRARERIFKVLFEIAWRAEDGLAKNFGVKSNPGRSRNYDAMCITACSAHAWHKLTGKKATPGHKDRGKGERSPFEQFLGKIFHTIGIRANPEHYAREMRRGGWGKILEEHLRQRGESIAS